MNKEGAQDALWGVVNSFGPLWWYALSGLCILSILFVLRQRPEHRTGRKVTLLVRCAGLCALALIPANSAFLPIGLMVFMGGYVLTAYFRMKDHMARGVARPVSSVMQVRDMLDSADRDPERRVGHSD